MATIDEGLEALFNEFPMLSRYGRRDELKQAILDLMCKHRGCDNPLLPYDEDAPAPRKILGSCKWCGEEAG